MTPTPQPIDREAVRKRIRELESEISNLVLALSDIGDMQMLINGQPSVKRMWNIAQALARAALRHADYTAVRKLLLFDFIPPEQVALTIAALNEDGKAVQP